MRCSENGQYIEENKSPMRKGWNMNNKRKTAEAKAARKRRASRFLNENGLLLAALICLTILGGAFALILGTKQSPPETPAEHSYDERIADVRTADPKSDPTYPAILPSKTPKPSEGTAPAETTAPTLMPDLTPAPSATPAPKPREPWISPVDGKIIRVFAMDGLIWSKTLKQWMTHPGVDIAAPKGTEVRSIEEGVVERVYDDDLMGTTVIIAHDGGIKTVYSGLKKDPPVKEGDSVAIRALIGYVGDTSISECSEESHLHFEFILNDQWVDPVNYVVIKSGETD